MTNNSTKLPAQQAETESAVLLLDDWFDPIEAGLRDRVLEFLQVMIESELEAALARATAAAQRPKSRMPIARALSPATGTVTDRGH
jgi:hypothetical protein